MAIREYRLVARLGFDRPYSSSCTIDRMNGSSLPSMSNLTLSPLSLSLHGGAIHRLPLGHLVGVHGADSLLITRRVSAHEQRILGRYDRCYYALETLLRLPDQRRRKGETVQWVILGQRDLVMTGATQSDGQVVDVHYHAVL